MSTLLLDEEGTVALLGYNAKQASVDSEKKYSKAWHITYMFPIKFKCSSLILNTIKTLIEFDEIKFLHDYILCTTSFCYDL